MAGLHSKRLLLTVLETGESKIQVPANLMSGAGLLPGSQMIQLLFLCENPLYMYSHELNTLCPCLYETSP